MSTDDPVRGPSLPFTIEQHQRALLASLRTFIVGRVVRYDADQQLVDVQPLVKDWSIDEEGERVIESFPVITNCGVQFLTAGGFTFTVPIVANPQTGTTGSLWFAERSLDRWFTGTGAEVDPELYLRFDKSSAIFMPGVLPFGAPMSVAPPTDHATAGSITGCRVHFRDSTIIIGDEAGAQFVALANLVLDELEKVKTAHNTHVHVLTIAAQAGAGGTGTAAPPVITYTPAPVAATQAKAK